MVGKLTSKRREKSVIDIDDDVLVLCGPCWPNAITNGRSLNTSDKSVQQLPLIATHTIK